MNNKDTQEAADKAIDKFFSNLGLACTIQLKEKMKVTFQGNAGSAVVANPFTSLIASLFLSFILGCFMNTYTVNYMLQMFDSVHSIHWFLGGVLACIPKIGRYTIPAFVITFLCANFIN